MSRIGLLTRRESGAHSRRVGASATRLSRADRQAESSCWAGAAPSRGVAVVALLREIPVSLPVATKQRIRQLAPCVGPSDGRERVRACGGVRVSLTQSVADVSIASTNRAPSRGLNRSRSWRHGRERGDPWVACAVSLACECESSSARTRTCCVRTTHISRRGLRSLRPCGRRPIRVAGPSGGPGSGSRTRIGRGSARRVRLWIDECLSHSSSVV